MAAQKAALEQSTKFLNEEKDKLTKTKNKEDTLSKELSGSDGLETKLINKNKEIASGIDDGAEDSSKSLQKMIKRGIYSCEDYQNKGLTKVTEKIKFGNEEKEITYCYYSECDGKLFFTSDFKNISSVDKNLYFGKPQEGCFSISLKHEANEKITGKIKFSLKTETWNISPKTKRGALFITEFELHKNNTTRDKFENTFIGLESDINDQNWKVKEKQKWDDSHKDKYTYDYLKNKFSGEFRKLEIWNVEDFVLNDSRRKSKDYSLMRDMSKRYLNLFDKGSDLWDWSERNIKDKNHFNEWNTKIWQYLIMATSNNFGVWKEISL